MAYWYCLTHERVEQDEGSVNKNRMGPYDTEEAARNWRETAEARNEEWDEQDERWRNG